MTEQSDRGGTRPVPVGGPVDLDPIDALLPPPFTGHPADAYRAEQAELVEQAVAALPPLTLKPFVPWPHEARADAALAAVEERRDHQPLADLYAAVGPYDRVELVRRAGSRLSLEETDELVERSSRAPVALLARAAALIDGGWQARGTDSGESVSELGHVTFEAYLKWALELAEEAAATMPGDIVPLVVAQSTGAVADGLDDVWRIAERWRRIDPFNYFANDALLRMLSPRWHGDDGDALRVVTELHDAAAPAHVAHALVPTVLAERYLVEVHLRRSPAGPGNDIFRSQATLLREAAEASIFHPAWRRGFLEGRIRNEFAFALYFGDQDALAWRVLRTLRGHAQPQPWNLKFADGLQVYEDSRAWLVRSHGVD